MGLDQLPLEIRETSSMQSRLEAPGLSGPKITVILLILLSGLCGSIIFTLAVYDRLNAARTATDEQWRRLSNLLSNDYQQLSQRTLTDQTIADQRLRTRQQQDILKSVDYFRTTVQPEQQRLMAEQVENLSAQEESSDWRLPAASSELKESVLQYNQCLARERNILSSMGGKLLQTILVLPERRDLQLPR